MTPLMTPLMLKRSFLCYKMNFHRGVGVGLTGDVPALIVVKFVNKADKMVLPFVVFFVPCR